MTDLRDYPLSEEKQERLEKALAEQLERSEAPPSEGEQAKSNDNLERVKDNERAEPLNPYLAFGFWEFAILGTLITVITSPSASSSTSDVFVVS
jgi:hypothetical protein